MSQARAGHSHRRWRISNKKHAIDHVRNDINVTPLVDVMLVLLIIFMLMTLTMGRGYDVRLPKAHYYSPEKDNLLPVVSVACESTDCGEVSLYFEKTKLGPIEPATLLEMGNRLKTAWAAPKTKEAAEKGSTLYVKADQFATYGKVYPLLLYLNKELLVQSIELAIALDAEGK